MMSDAKVCINCGLQHDAIEVSGIHFCPNPMCTAPGAAWFRCTLHSYREHNDGTHTIDSDEWLEEGIKYLKEHALELDPDVVTAAYERIHKHWPVQIASKIEQGTGCGEGGL